MVKNPPVMLETWVQSLGWDDPLRRHDNPLEYSCLENPMDRGAWPVPWGRTEPDTTEQLSMHTRVHTHSCLHSFPLWFITGY